MYPKMDFQMKTITMISDLHFPACIGEILHQPIYSTGRILTMYKISKENIISLCIYKVNVTKTFVMKISRDKKEKKNP